MMHKFDYNFLLDKLPSNLISLAMGIGALKAKEELRKENNKPIFTALEKLAKLASVKHSNEIEGIITSDKRIKELVNGNTKPLNHNEEEIAGYIDALSLIHNNYQTLQVNEEDILSLHALMLSYTSSQDAGIYKKSDNVIIEIDSANVRRVRFEPVSAELTPSAMQQLILAYRLDKGEATISPLLLIPCFILDFLCIHPFNDGNGRMSRLLSLLLLYKEGYDIGKYISFEEQINKRKEFYYEALKQSSTNWHDNKNDYGSFISNFLLTLLICYKQLDKRFIVIKDKRNSKTNRVEALILDSLIPISKAEIATYLPDISITTIEKVLSALLKENKIRKIGSYKNAKYLRREK